MFKLTHSKHPTPPYGITMIRIGTKSVFWKKWHSSGICNIADLFEDHVFILYSDLVRKYKLKRKDNFWKYLQIRSCLPTRFSTEMGTTSWITSNYLGSAIA